MGEREGGGGGRQGETSPEVTTNFILGIHVTLCSIEWPLPLKMALGSTGTLMVCEY